MASSSGVASHPRLVLTMIVKNESAVIERCLRSLMPLIDAWCIVDTGSSDDTREIVRSMLGHLPGELHDSPWVDFAHNRTEALEWARPLGEYSLMIDADVSCHIDETVDLDGFKRSLVADHYGVVIQDDTHYQRPLLTSTRLPYHYRGVLHEFLVVPDGAVNGGIIEEFHYHSSFDGARSMNPNKWHDDVAVLERALARGDEPDLASRYTFYLAQSLASAGRSRDALDAYHRCAGLGGWQEEVYIASMRAAKLRQDLGDPIGMVLDDFMRAHDVFPARAETLCHAATAARLAGRMPTAYLYAQRAMQIPRPEVSLFLEPDVYEWRTLYELSIAAYYVGRPAEGRAASNELLAGTAIPLAERGAVEGNLRFYA